MTYDDDLVWDGEILFKALCCDETFYIEYDRYKNEWKYIKNHDTMNGDGGD